MESIYEKLGGDKDEKAGEEEVGSEYFVLFQRNEREKFSEIKDESKELIKKLMIWTKGKSRTHLSYEEIWNEKEEREKSNVDKISFTTLLIFSQFVKEKLEKEGKGEIIEEILYHLFEENKKDFSQLFFSIDQYELESYVVEEILGNCQSDLKKKDFMVEILVKFDFLLLKGRQKFDKNKYTVSKRDYLIPLLFPKCKPFPLLLSNPHLLVENQKDSSLLQKSEQWKMLYYLPFKPSALWKMLFIRLRNACVESEEKYKMLNEYYWMNGTFLSNIPLKKRK